MLQNCGAPQTSPCRTRPDQGHPGRQLLHGADSDKDKKDKIHVRQRQSRLVLQLPPVTVSSAAQTRKKGWQCWNWEKNYF